MRDSAALQKQGIPTVLICTELFVREAEAVKKIVGVPEMKLVIIPHPLATLNDAEIKQRAEEILTKIVDSFKD